MDPQGRRPLTSTDACCRLFGVFLAHSSTSLAGGFFLQSFRPSIYFELLGETFVTFKVKAACKRYYIAAAVIAVAMYIFLIWQTHQLCRETLPGWQPARPAISLSIASRLALFTVIASLLRRLFSVPLGMQRWLLRAVYFYIFGHSTACYFLWAAPIHQVGLNQMLHLPCPNCACKLKYKQVSTWFHT